RELGETAVDLVVGGLLTRRPLPRFVRLPRHGLTLTASEETASEDTGARCGHRDPLGWDLEPAPGRRYLHPRTRREQHRCPRHPRSARSPSSPREASRPACPPPSASW